MTLFVIWRADVYKHSDLVYLVVGSNTVLCTAVQYLVDYL